ncbi:MAG TPA: hypothetical protein VJM11_11285 [Nevskiaceae bacterium]|nr:hypothetical protein [Nevskiaceae bacterium]
METMETRRPPHICPRCRSEDIVGLPRRRVVDRVVAVFGRRLYRCEECRTLFYDRRSVRKAS